MRRTYSPPAAFHVFRPHAEPLESRNAPGEVLLPTVFALWDWDSSGDKPSRIVGNVTAHAALGEESSFRQLARAEFADSIPPAESRKISPSPVAPGVRETPAADALANTASLLFTPLSDALVQPMSRRDALGRRWSEQLEELLRQSLRDRPLPQGVGAEVAVSHGGMRGSATTLTSVAGPRPLGINVIPIGLANLTVRLTGDTDRDGSVTDADLPGRGAWTRDRGALYAVNFDDDDGDGRPDAVDWNDQGRPSDENAVVENDRDVRDLAAMRISPLGAGFTPGLRVYLRAGSVEDAESIHVFPYLAPGATAVLGGVGTRAGGKEAATEADVTAWVSPTSDAHFGVEGLLFRNRTADAALASTATWT